MLRVLLESVRAGIPLRAAATLAFRQFLIRFDLILSIKRVDQVSGSAGARPTALVLVLPERRRVALTAKTFAADGAFDEVRWSMRR